jgi:hypothetical protein
MFRIRAPGGSISRNHPVAAGNDAVAVAGTAFKCFTDKDLCDREETWELQQTACMNMDCSNVSLATSN